MFYTLLGAIAGALLGILAYVLAGTRTHHSIENGLLVQSGMTGAFIGAIAGAAQAVVGAIRRLERMQQTAPADQGRKPRQEQVPPNGERDADHE